jgi:DNA-binding CsgD family transcriptional regulator
MINQDRETIGSIRLRENPRLVVAVLVAILGFGLWHGARDIASWVGPYSSSRYAFVGLLSEGISYLIIAALSYRGLVNRAPKLFVLGLVAITADVVLYIVVPVPALAQIFGQILLGFGTAMIMLSWIEVLTAYRNSFSLTIILVGYALSVLSQVAVNSFLTNYRMGALAVVFVLSSIALAYCMRINPEISRIMVVRISPKTTIEQMFARFRRVAISVGVFTLTFGFILQLDIINGLEYAQTVVSGLANFGVALLGIIVILAFNQRQLNSDFITPIAAVLLATILLYRFLDNSNDYLSGAMTTTFIMFYGVLIWLILIPEAHERKLSAFFLLGLVLGIDRICILSGRYLAGQLSPLIGADSSAAFTGAIWLLTILLAYIFYSHRRSAKIEALAETEQLEELELQVIQDSQQHEDCLIETLRDKYSLSKREAEIICDFRSGRSARRIAEAQVLSEHTVKTHIRRVYGKMNIHSKQQLIDLFETELRHEESE